MLGRAVSVSKKHFVGLRTVSIVALAAVAMLSSWSFGAAHHASAHQPHPGLEFHIGIDTTGDSVDDCSTVGDAKGFCSVPVGNTFVVNAYVDSTGLSDYDAFNVWEDFTGVVAKSDPDGHWWPDCVGPAALRTATFSVVGCSTLGPAVSSYTGKVATATYTCTADGTIALTHGESYTNLNTMRPPYPHFHAENGPDVLNIRCFGPSLGGVAAYPELPGSANVRLIASAAGGVAMLTLVAGLIWRRRSLTAED